MKTVRHQKVPRPIIDCKVDRTTRNNLDTIRKHPFVKSLEPFFAEDGLHAISHAAVGLRCASIPLQLHSIFHYEEWIHRGNGRYLAKQTIKIEDHRIGRRAEPRIVEIFDDIEHYQLPTQVADICIDARNKPIEKRPPTFVQSHLIGAMYYATVCALGAESHTCFDELKRIHEEQLVETRSGASKHALPHSRIIWIAVVVGLQCLVGCEHNATLGYIFDSICAIPHPQATHTLCL